MRHLVLWYPRPVPGPYEQQLCPFWRRRAVFAGPYGTRDIEDFTEKRQGSVKTMGEDKCLPSGIPLQLSGSHERPSSQTHLGSGRGSRTRPWGPR